MGNLRIKLKLTTLIQKGISFELSQDKLIVKGDLSILSNDDKEFLKTNKKTIIYLIEENKNESSTIQKIDNNTNRPLSFSQQGLWLLDKINEGSNHYNLNLAFKLIGKVNYEALNKTFLTILQRHESLRTSFLVDSSGNPFQKIQSVNSFNIVVEELKESKDIELQVNQKIDEELHRIFDLTKDLLLNIRFLKVNQETHILIVNMHHIASDGWSMKILIKEFNILYSNFSKGKPDPLPELDIQYSDYAYWQRNWLKGHILKEHVTYWKNKLSDLPILHNLPLDKKRPVVQSYNGKVYSSNINIGVLESLKEFCKTEGASLFMGIYSAFNVLLARYSNETDIVIGSPIANREQVEVSNLVGFFMNLLVLRSDLSQNPNFKELLKQSKKILEEAYEYQQMPFGKIVEELEVKKNLGHNPLFQILITFQNYQQDELSTSNLTMESINYSRNNAKYDLSLDIVENSKGLNLSWEYNVDLFEENSIINFGENFNTLLISLLSNPEENVFKVNLIRSSKIDNIYRYLKGIESELVENDQAIKAFDQQVQKNNKEIAVICNDISYNYKQLNDRVNLIIYLLLNKKVQKGGYIGICLLRNIDLVAAIFACLKVGLAYIPLDPIYPSERLNQIIIDAKLKCIITLKPLQKLYFEKLPTKDFVYLDTLEFQKKNKIDTSKYVNNDIAYIIFTSGTTGKPKGIEITQGNLTNLLKGFDISFGSTSKQIWLAQTSVNFDISVLELIWTISRGHTIILQETNPFRVLASDRLNITSKIDFSIMFFGADKDNDCKYQSLLETAKFSDENNFTAIWTPERHFGEFGGAFPSPSVLSAALSVLTKRIDIRSGSIVLPLHDSVRVAEEWSLIDNLSNGRIGISVASGWQPDDFVFLNSDYSNRHKEMKEKIKELKNLWEGNLLVRKNGFDKDFSIKIRPKPIQKELPLWITAAGNPETFKYAGEIGANLLTHMLGQSLEDLQNNITIYHKSLKDNGFVVNDKKVTLMLHTYIDSTEQVAFEISEKPFKDYLGSSIKLMEPLAKEIGIDINTQTEELIDIAYKKFSKENTLIGSPESCQKMLFNLQKVGVTEIACLIDFGVKNKKRLASLEKIVETKKLYQNYREFVKLLNLNNQKTELDLIAKYGITHVQMTPSQTRLIVDLYKQTNDRELTSIQHWFIGGEIVNEILINDLSAITNCKLYNMYGPTETTVWSTWREIKNKDIFIGKPITNTNLLLVNKFEQQVPINVIGELCIGGLGVGKGYHNNIKLTNEKFKNINNPYFGNIRFYKTGDLMKLKEDGIFEYIGRKDNQVKINGYRIEPEEVEKVILKISGIKNCKVIPVLNGTITSLSAFIVKDDIVYGKNNLSKILNLSNEKGYDTNVKIIGKGNKKISSEEEMYKLSLKNNKNKQNNKALQNIQAHIYEGIIKDYLRFKLPDYMNPSKITFISNIPLMGNGKVNLVILKKLERKEPLLNDHFVKPTNKTELSIYNIWSEILNKKNISIDDNFFQIGGNSMKAFQLLEILKKTLKIDLKIIALFQYPTIRLMSNYLNERVIDNSGEALLNQSESLDDVIDFMEQI